MSDVLWSLLVALVATGPLIWVVWTSDKEQ